MNIQKLVRKLRHAADVLNAIFIEDYENETPIVAKKILSRRKTRKIRKNKGGFKKGFKYTKANPHWMQRPENRKRVQAMTRRAWKARMRNK